MSYRIVVNNGTGKLTKAFNMKTGQIGIIRSGGYEGEVVLRSHGDLVSLTSPVRNWPFDEKMPSEAPSFDVELLPPDASVTIFPA